MPRLCVVMPTTSLSMVMAKAASSEFSATLRFSACIFSSTGFASIATALIVSIFACSRPVTIVTHVLLTFKRRDTRAPRTITDSPLCYDDFQPPPYDCERIYHHAPHPDYLSLRRDNARAGSAEEQPKAAASPPEQPCALRRAQPEKAGGDAGSRCADRRGHHSARAVPG